MQISPRAGTNRRIPTSERLVLAAIPLIWRHGYNAVSVDAICEAGGAHKGSFYYAFPSKAALLVRALHYHWERDGGELRALAALPGSPDERLDRHLDWFLTNQERYLSELGFVPGHFHMAIDINVPDAATAVTDHRAEAAAMLRELLEEALRRRGSPTDAAEWLTDTICHLISGLMIEARLGDSLDPVRSLKPTVHRLLELQRPHATR